MPPFGTLYGVPVVVDETVYRDREIAFNCGDHTSIMRMEFADFERLVQPTRADIADLH
jgi:Ala-tRNA(Pro) deacylase